jgi:hypothetical protein
MPPYTVRRNTAQARAARETCTAATYKALSNSFTGEAVPPNVAWQKLDEDPRWKLQSWGDHYRIVLGTVAWFELREES